ncbi:ATP synthase F1 subunit gamma [Membranicola marinus]|uniref:ATP synthase gamma chain n=1 Tax=Membranihabitans marinus TaxID=1227546 RepID=A0A953HN94_9BACT|nr:ATP synthase F1 subunit gamma [Membranihabitans marinus]MBY5958234.1 ATP synthase F1 subunit gamma [Membranihabitans marinus]
MGANLKEVRERISSVINTQKSTRAMKMVSASKLRRAQDAITRLRPYSEKLDHIMRNILSNMDEDVNNQFSSTKEPEKILIVLITSSRGLAGAFNSNLIKQTVHLIKNTFAEQVSQGQVEILSIGKKGADYIKKNFPEIPLNTDYINLFEDLDYQNLMRVSQELMDRFLDEKVDRIEVVYSKFKNAAVQIPSASRFLPVRKLSGISRQEIQSDGNYRADYIFEPDQNTVLEQLIPSILHIKFQKYILDTHAAEHGARMTAMDQATENADDLLKDLRISFNKARQEAITNEISEIVGGVAALQG